MWQAYTCFSFRGFKEIYRQAGLYTILNSLRNYRLKEKISIIADIMVRYDELQRDRQPALPKKDTLFLLLEKNIKNRIYIQIYLKI